MSAFPDSCLFADLHFGFYSSRPIQLAWQRFPKIIPGRSTKLSRRALGVRRGAK